MAKQGWKPGRWRAICDRCGLQYYSTDLSKEWTGLMVCRPCFEPRHPQDFIRSKPEKIVPPWTRPESTDTFINVCSLWTASGMADYGTADCMRASSATTIQLLLDNFSNLGTLARPTEAIAAITISGVI